MARTVARPPTTRHACTLVGYPTRLGAKPIRRPRPHDPKEGTPRSGTVPPVGEAFDVAVKDDGPNVTMTVTGELDLATAPRLRDACADVVARRPETVRVDLGGLAFLDSSGISVLVQLHHDLEEGGATLVLHRVGDRTARVLEIAGLAAFFTRSDQPVE